MISLKNRNGSKNGSSELKKEAAASRNGSTELKNEYAEFKNGSYSTADPSRTGSSGEFKNSSAPPRPGSGDLKNGGGATSSKHGTPKSKNGGGGLFAALKPGKTDVSNEQENGRAAAGEHKNAKSEKSGYGCEENPRDKNGGGSKSDRRSACQLPASNGVHHTSRQYIH